MRRASGFPSSPPAPGAVAPFVLPDVYAGRLDSRLELRVVRKRQVPVATALLVMDAGESALPGKQAGLAVLAGKALDAGTVRRSATELACAFENMGAHLGTSTGWESTVVSVTCTTERFARAIELLSEVATTPGFPEREVGRIREQQLAGIRQQRMFPAQLASRATARFFFRPGTTYSRPLAGAEDTVAALGREEVTGFAARRYRPAGAALVVVGDVDAARVTDLASEHLGGWKGEAPPPRASSAPRFDELRIVVLHRPGAVQSEIRIGHAATGRNTPDYFSLIVLNALLGGTFTSRLNLNLREDKGFTYGVHSSFVLRRAGGLFCIASAVGADVTAEAVSEALGETSRLVAEGPTEAEVRSARDYLAGVFPLRLETSAQIAAGLARAFIFRLPADYHARYRAQVQAVEVQDVVRAAARHLDPAAMTVVVVGDADRVAPGLEALGPVEVLDDH